MGMLTFDQASKVIKSGNIVLLRTELDAGLSPNLANKYSWTLFMLAALRGNTCIGRLLIERGAEVGRTNMFQQTASLLAACQGNISFVRMLRAAGASLEPDQRSKLEPWLRLFYHLPEVKIKKLLSLLEIEENHT